MLLVLSTSDDATANYMCERLSRDSISFVRVDTDTFSTNGSVEYGDSEPRLVTRGLSYSPRVFLNVWYRRPRAISVQGNFAPESLLHTSREWGAVVDGFLGHIPPDRWMNHPANNAAASSKLRQLTVAKKVGFHVPDTLVTQCARTARLFLDTHKSGVIVKPLSIGYVESLDGDVLAMIHTERVPVNHVLDDEVMRRCPTLFQEEIIRGVDVRVTYVDGEITAVFQQPNGDDSPVDIRKNSLTAMSHHVEELPPNVAIAVQRVAEAFHLRFCAIDLIRCSRGDWFFLEINPNGQWAWMDLLGASDIAGNFCRAFKRTID